MAESYLNSKTKYEYFINETMGSLPREQYDKFLRESYRMQLMQEFLVWQNQLESLCFGDRASEKLSRTFEKLSGSRAYKQKYERLRHEIAASEARLKAVSDKLKQLRLEKIRLKGMTDFQK